MRRSSAVKEKETRCMTCRSNDPLGYGSYGATGTQRHMACRTKKMGNSKQPPKRTSLFFPSSRMSHSFPRRVLSTMAPHKPAGPTHWDGGSKFQAKGGGFWALTIHIPGNRGNPGNLYQTMVTPGWDEPMYGSGAQAWCCRASGSASAIWRCCCSENCHPFAPFMASCPLCSHPEPFKWYQMVIITVNHSHAQKPFTKGKKASHAGL